MDLTQNNLPPAVPLILVSMILSEAQTVEQCMNAAKWFLKVGEEGFRFTRANQLLEFIRRAMEFRRSGTASWDGSDVWRAREDHTIVAQGSKVCPEGYLGRPGRDGYHAPSERFQPVHHPTKGDSY